MTLAVSSIPLDSSVNGHFNGRGDGNYYKMTVAAGQTINLNLGGLASGALELYVKRGNYPTWDITPNTGAANVAGIHVGIWVGPYINWNER